MENLLNESTASTNGYDPDRISDMPAMKGQAPIAINGMACRLPGGITNPDELWDSLAAKESGWSDLTTDRFNGPAFYHPDPNKKSTTHAKGAHFLQQDIFRFDAPFFNISVAEAAAIDPQQRLLLEVTYEALEHAGLPLQAISGQKIGVFVGASRSDYDSYLRQDPQMAPMFGATGSGSQAVLANRISYVFNLKGPSFTVDTACSSGLTALHVGCQSLRAGEITYAVVAGSHLNVTSEGFVGLSNLRLLGGEGRCFSFDKRATDGFGRGEGVACLILSCLDLTLKNSDPVRSLIRSTSCNQDGLTTGLTLPSDDAQEDMIREAYSAAGLSPLDTDFIEAHGTGTARGDPLELEALGRVFGRLTPDEPVYVGSIKSNIGHLEGTSGLASTIKAAMMVERGFILPNHDFKTPNPNIPLDSWNFKVPKEYIPWPGGRVRRASVNNFGFGGSNSHVVLEDPSSLVKRNTTFVNGKDSAQDKRQSLSRRRRLYTLSAASQRSLRKQAIAVASYLTEPHFSATFMKELAFTLGERRSMHELRLAVPAETQQDLMIGLQDESYVQNRVLSTPKVGFVFTGQGAQYANMGQDLQKWSTEYRNAIHAADHQLQNLGASFSLIEELAKGVDSTLIGKSAVAQPACIAVQLALVDMIKAWGIVPEAVIGHSSGEIAAAYAAEILTFDECLDIAYHRGLASQQLQGASGVKGAMLALGADSAQVSALMKQVKQGRAVVACVNSPVSTTISGDESAVLQVLELAKEKAIFARRLQVETAYHSHHMLPVAEAYRSALGQIKPRSGSNTKFFSSLKGGQCSPLDLVKEYWIDNLVSPVEFSNSFQAMCSATTEDKDHDFIDLVIEVGPHPALAGPIKQCLQATKTNGSVEYLFTLSRGGKEVEFITDLASQLLIKGCLMKMEIVNATGNQGCKPDILVDLPGYPWDHEHRYLHDSRIARNFQLPFFPPHDLLGTLMPDSTDVDLRWRNILRIDAVPWVSHHKVLGRIVFPMTGYLCMALQAEVQKTAKLGHSVDFLSMREISISSTLTLQETAEVEMLLYLRPHTESSRGSLTVWDEFKIVSWSDGRCIEHCQGMILASDGDPTSPDSRFMDEPAVRDNKGHEISNLVSIDANEFYETFSIWGIEYGPTFRGLSGIRYGKSEAVGSVPIADTSVEMPYSHESTYVIHPATLDMCLQIMQASLRDMVALPTAPFLPTFVKHLSINPKLCKLTGQHLVTKGTAAPKNHSGRTCTGHVAVFDPNSSQDQPAIKFDEITLTRVEETTTVQAGRSLTPCAKIEWKHYLPLMTDEEYKRVLSLDVPDPTVLERIRSQEQVSYHYIEVAVKQLSDVKPEAPHLKKMYAWMEKQCHLARAGLLKLQESDWFLNDEAERHEIRERVRSQGPTGDFLCHMGDHLLQIMQGKVDTLSTMLENNRLGEMYKHNVSMTRACKIAAQYVDLLAHQNPAMNILEIGAGTAGATVPILERLGGAHGNPVRFRRYDFTDISTGFFEQARARLRDWGDLVHYHPLNIELDPQEQGFEKGRYDLIIAANVLHATEDILKTLSNVRRLLKAGGRLALVEITSPGLSPFPFGTTPGWWLSCDGKPELDGHPFREDGPTMTEGQWKIVLNDSGFAPLDGSVQDFGSLPEHSTSAMFASTVSLEDEIIHKRDFTIVFQRPLSCVASEDLAENELSRCLQSRLGLASTAIDFRDLRSTDLTDQLCIIIDSQIDPIMKNLDTQGYGGLQRLVTAKDVLWVTHGGLEAPDAQMVIGFSRDIRNEYQNVSFVTLDLEMNASLSDQATLDKIVGLAKRFTTEARWHDVEFHQKESILLVPRVLTDQSTSSYLVEQTRTDILTLQPLHQDCRHLKLELKSPGDPESIYFDDADGQSAPLGIDSVEVSAHAMGLNFKDVLVAFGRQPGHHLGGDFSGVVKVVGSNVTHLSVGDRVCGIALQFATTTRCSASAVARIPREMTLQTAAAIPGAFVTAYHALFNIAHLCEGESILIHSAAGGFGQASIALAQFLGAKIFATVGTTEKRDFLANTYDIPKERIFFSRSGAFKAQVLEATGGRGVDVILNSLVGEQLRLTFECIAPYGRFIEVGKKDILANHRLEMINFEKNVTFSALDLAYMVKDMPSLVGKILTKVLRLIDQGSLKPLIPISVYGMGKIAEAIRLLGSGKHIGKVVMELRADDRVMATQNPKQELSLAADARYLITGGTGGIGRSACRWLVENGARHVILASRRGSSVPEVVTLKQELAATFGATIDVRRCDVGDREQVKALITGSSEELGPIRGVIHGAMALEPRLFRNGSIEHWTEHVRPKVHGAWHLHDLLSKTDLDFFVMLSSLAGVLGGPGQAAYAATSTFLDGFAHFRRAQNLPADVIDLGVVGGVGYVAQNKVAQKQLDSIGMGYEITGAEVLVLLKAAISGKLGINCGHQTLVGLIPKDETTPWVQAALFAQIREEVRRNSSNARLDGATATEAASIPFRTRLGASNISHEEQKSIFLEAVRAKFSSVLMISEEEVVGNKAIAAFGIDSLVSIELRNWMTRELSVDISIQELLSCASVSGLVELMMTNSKLVAKN